MKQPNLLNSSIFLFLIFLIFTLTPPGLKAFTCEAAGSRAAGSGGRIGSTTSGQKSSD